MSTAPLPGEPGRRDVVDYALARRSVLSALRTGRATAAEVCDASPYLRRAARELGAPTDRACPVCTREQLWLSWWVYGDALGDASGSSRTQAQLRELGRTRPDFAVYEVEVCPGCGWNHLRTSWRTGTPGTRPARRSRRSDDAL